MIILYRRSPLINNNFISIDFSVERNGINFILVTAWSSRVAQGTYLEVEYIRNVLSVSGTLKYADSGTA